MSKSQIAIEKTIERLRAYAKKKNLTKSAFAKQAGLDNKTLKDFWEPTWKPSLSTIQKLEAII